MSEVGLVLALLLAWGYVFGALWAVRRFVRRRIVAGGAPAPEMAEVSVLKPLYGLDPGLAENLRSFAEQDYSGFQIVLGVRDRTDPALALAQRLQQECQHCDIEVVVDPHVSGTNLKVSNLENMLPVARHDIILLADSDMRVTPDYLATVTAPLADPRAGLVTCLYKGIAGPGLLSELAA